MKPFFIPLAVCARPASQCGKTSAFRVRLTLKAKGSSSLIPGLCSFRISPTLSLIPQLNGFSFKSGMIIGKSRPKSVAKKLMSS